MPMFYLSQRMRKSVMTYSLNKFYTSSLIGGFIEVKFVQFSENIKKVVLENVKLIKKFVIINLVFK